MLKVTLLLKSGKSLELRIQMQIRGGGSENHPRISLAPFQHPFLNCGDPSGDIASLIIIIAKSPVFPRSRTLWCSRFEYVLIEKKFIEIVMK